MLKKTMLCLAAALSLALPTMSHAANPQLPGLEDANNLPTAQAQTLDFLGCVQFGVLQSTTPVLVYSGPGMLYEVDTTSGTGYAVAFDSNTIGTVGGATYPLGLNAVANLPTKVPYLSPRVWTDSLGAAPTVAGQGRYLPNRPRRFATGLVIANSESAMSTTGCYRTDAMDAALPVTQ